MFNNRFVESFFFVFEKIHLFCSDLDLNISLNRFTFNLKFVLVFFQFMKWDWYSSIKKTFEMKIGNKLFGPNVTKSFFFFFWR